MELVVGITLQPSEVCAFGEGLYIDFHTITNYDRNWKRRIQDNSNIQNLPVIVQTVAGGITCGWQKTQLV